MDTNFETVSAGRLTVITVGVACVVVAAPDVADTAVVETLWLPEAPVATVPEGTVSVNVLRSPTIWPAATTDPTCPERPMTVVFAPAFLVMVVMVSAFPATTMVLPTTNPLTAAFDTFPSYGTVIEVSVATVATAIVDPPRPVDAGSVGVTDDAFVGVTTDERL